MLRFWGKTGEDDAFHPALMHMLDVGAVAAVFLERAASPALRVDFQAVVQPGGAGDAAPPDFLRNWLPVLAALHDIGKVSPGFQAKAPDLFKRLRRGVSAAPEPGASGEHDMTTLHALGGRGRILNRLGFEPDASYDLARTLAGHHGRFKNPTPYHDSVLWAKARQDMADCVVRMFGAIKAPTLVASLPAAWCMTLGGLVSVCDWIGSSEEYFPPAFRVTPQAGDLVPTGHRPVPSVLESGRDADLAPFLRDARLRATRALDELGFTGWRADGGIHDFEVLFPGLVAKEVQQAAIRMADGLSEPGLLLIEAPTGIGKTEAALAAADRMANRFGLGGIYVALPTQATSNQMFLRVQAFVERRYPGARPDLHLLHGMSDLVEDYRALRVRADAPDGDDIREGAIASSWFASSRRSLLAPFGVGTIDQSLLSVLWVRHLFVRMLGLGRKVVVFDEVHAYDTYMSRILDRLLSWLAALGSPVVLLSATLPPSRRGELVKAYCGSAPEDIAGYPQIVACTPRSRPAVHVVTPESGRQVDLDRCPLATADPDLLARRILDRVSLGGCVAWICNTVNGAQQAFRMLAENAPPDVELHLLHARFPVERRLAIEAAIQRRFRKDGDRPAKAVLVATQVVEQSLDLDFDWMVSDLAPIDLLLQRMGRLHRHDRPERPARFGNPTLTWIDPVDDLSAPSFGVWAKVYHASVLIRTWAALTGRACITVPDDVPGLIRVVYEAGVPSDAPWAERLRSADEEHARSIGKEAYLADLALLPVPTAADALFEWGIVRVPREDPGGADEHSLVARTRLSHPSATVICVLEDRGRMRLVDGLEYDMGSKLDAPLVRRLLRSSLAIQNREWVAHFHAQAVPPSWRSHHLLRDCHPVIFHDRRFSHPGGRRVLELSDELGLRDMDVSNRGGVS